VSEPGAHTFSVTSTSDIYQGKILALRVDEVAMPGGGTAKREVVETHAAVGLRPRHP
jgi:hypothetical protein